MAATVDGTVNRMANGTSHGPDDLAGKLQRWSAKLASLPSLALPTDYPRPSKWH